jgi:hypothetical protein
MMGLYERTYRFCGPLLFFEEKYEDGDGVDLGDRAMTYTCYLFVMGLVSVSFEQCDEVRLLWGMFRGSYGLQ